MAGLKLEADVSNVISGVNKIADGLDKAGIKADTFVRDLRGIEGAMKNLAAIPSSVKLSGTFGNMSEAVKAARTQIQAMQTDMVKNISQITDAVTKLQAAFNGVSATKGFDGSKISGLASKLNIPATPQKIKDVPHINQLSTSNAKNISAGAKELVKALDGSLMNYIEGAREAISSAFAKTNIQNSLKQAAFSPVGDMSFRPGMMQGKGAFQPFAAQSSRGLLPRAQGLSDRTVAMSDKTTSVMTTTMQKTLEATLEDVRTFVDQKVPSVASRIKPSKSNSGSISLPVIDKLLPDEEWQPDVFADSERKKIDRNNRKKVSGPWKNEHNANWLFNSVKEEGGFDKLQESIQRFKEGVRAGLKPEDIIGPVSKAFDELEAKIDKVRNKGRKDNIFVSDRDKDLVMQWSEQMVSKADKKAGGAILGVPVASQQPQPQPRVPVDFKNIGELSTSLKGSTEAEIKSIIDFVKSTTKAFTDYRNLLEQNANVEGGKVLTRSEQESSRALYAGMRDLGMILPGAGLDSKILPNSIRQLRESVYAEGRDAGTRERISDYVPKNPEKERAQELGDVKSRLEAALNDTTLPKELRETFHQAVHEFEEALSKSQLGGSRSGGRSGSGSKGRAGSYRNSEEYLNRRLDTEASRADSYARVSRTGEMNANLRMRNEALDQALKRMRLMGGGGAYGNGAYGGGIGGMFGNNGGFLSNFGGALAQNMASGYGGLNIAWALRQAAVGSARSGMTDRLIGNYAFTDREGNGGMKELLLTDAAFNEDTFQQNLKGLEGFKKFVQKVNEGLKDSGQVLTQDEALSRLKSGDLSRNELLQGLSAEERKSLLRGLSSDRRTRNRVLGNIRSNENDRTIVASGLTRNQSAMGALAGAAGAILPVMAVTKLSKAISNLGKASIKAFESIEKLQTQMDVVFSSEAQSAEMFGNIKDYARKTPFGVEQTTQQAILLRQSGVYASELMDTIKRLGDMSSGNADKLKTLTDVYARVTSSMTVTARDLRQLSNAGVASYKALSDATGIQQSQIRSRLQAGKITATDFQKMVKNLTDEGGTFYGATERGAKTLAGRKQRLSDTFTLAKAEYGELLAKLGGTDTTNSLLGKIMSIAEDILNDMRKTAERANDNKTMNAADAAMKSYQENKKLYEEALAGGDKDLIKARKENMDKSYEEWEKTRAGQESVAVARWEEAKKVIDQLKQGKIDGHDIVGAASGRNAVEGMVWNTDSKGVMDAQELNDFIDNFMGSIDFSSGDVVDQIREKAKGLTVQYIDGISEQMDEMGNVYEVIQTKTVNIEDVLVDNFQNMLAGVANEVDKAGKAANDVLDGIIRAADVKIDDVEDISRKLNEMTASQSRMSNARTDWNQNSSVAQMMLRDANAARDENLKRRIMYYEDERGILDKDTGKYNLGKLNLNEFKEAEDLITADSSEMNLNIGALWDAATDSMIEGADETLKKYAENISEVMDSVMQSGGEDLLGSEGYDTFVSLFGALKRASSDINKDNITSVIMLMDQVDKMADNLAASNSQFGEAFKTSVQRAKLDKTRDTENKKYINKRKQADLWAQIISQTTGISADRVQLSGARASMAAYTSNFARRDMFSTLGKSLMQNGVSLKELSDVIKDNKKGGGYDWIGASNGIEAMAAKRSVETQDALINAYQQQIDTLNNLEMAGVATRDQWDNLGSLSAQLGVGFNLAAQEMADGSYRFTEATIQAAEDMKRELNLKKFVQQLDSVFNRKITELNKSTMETGLKAAFVGKDIDFAKSLNVQSALDMGEIYASQLDILSKENVDTIGDVLATNASNNNLRQILKSLTKDDVTDLNKIDERYWESRPVSYSKQHNFQYLLDGPKDIFGKYQEKVLKELEDEVVAPKTASKDPTQTGRASYKTAPIFTYKEGTTVKKTEGGLSYLVDLLASNEAARKKVSEFNADQKSKKNRTNIDVDDKNLVTSLRNLTQRDYNDLLRRLTPIIKKEEFERQLTAYAKENEASLGVAGKDWKLDPVMNLGPKQYEYGLMWDEGPKSGSYDAGEYKTRKVLSEDVKDLIKEIQEKLKSGNLSTEDYENYIKLLQILYPKLMDSTKTLKDALERNTLATNKLAAAQETAGGLDKIQEFYKMTGRLGLGMREKTGTGHRASYDAKAYGDMEEYAPGRMHINTFAQDRMLEWLGLPKDTDFKGMLGRYSENFVPKYARDRLQGIKEGEMPQSIEELYIDQLKTEKLIAEDEEGNPLVDEQGNVLLKNNLTDDQKARASELSQERDKNLLAMGNFSDQIGAYLVNNKNGIIRGAGKDAEGNRMSKEDKQHLKELLTPEENEFGEMELGEDKMMEALALLDKYGVGIDDLVEKWARFAAAQVDSSLALKQMGENMKNAFKDAGANAILDTTKLIGENMYKIENSLMTQEESTETIKKSLAGQAAALLDNISKEAVIAGLRLIGAGALSSPVGWGMIAAGIGLAAAGGFGSIASGLLSGYAGDNSKNTAEEEIARLESLRNNLADLLKQAKDDAEYYEKNLRSKQAFQTNESISAMSVTKTNDMILSPQGVFSTHPDDYIMAMKDPASLMSANGSPNVNFTIVNASGTPLNVESTSQRRNENGDMDIKVVVNGIVQQSMLNGDYDQTFATIQAMQKGANISG